MKATDTTGTARLLRAPRELVPRFGRAVLWVAVAVVLLRGLAAMLATHSGLAA
jgi:hypothetical protein